jgi:hypothetical protein
VLASRHSSSPQVARIVLQNAASIADLMITTEAMVVELPKKGDPVMADGGMAAWAAWISDPSRRVTLDHEARTCAGLRVCGRVGLIKRGSTP